MGKSRCKKNHIASKVDDIEKLRMNHETDEYWKLRKEFLTKNYEKEEKSKLISLSNTYINIRVLGCRYPEVLMQRVTEMSEGLSGDWCGGWMNRRLVQTGSKYSKKFDRESTDEEHEEVIDDAPVSTPTWQKRPILDHGQNFRRDMLDGSDIKSGNITYSGDAQKISKKFDKNKKENVKPILGEGEIMSWKERKRQVKKAGEAGETVATDGGAGEKKKEFTSAATETKKSKDEAVKPKNKPKVNVNGKSIPQVKSKKGEGSAKQVTENNKPSCSATVEHKKNPTEADCVKENKPKKAKINKTSTSKPQVETKTKVQTQTSKGKDTGKAENVKSKIVRPKNPK